MAITRLDQTIFIYISNRNFLIKYIGSAPSIRYQISKDKCIVRLRHQFECYKCIWLMKLFRMNMNFIIYFLYKSQQLPIHYYPLFHCTYLVSGVVAILNKCVSYQIGSNIISARQAKSVITATATYISRGTH